MIISIAKAEALMREMADRLAARLAGAAVGRVDSVRAAKDANGFPMLFLSHGGNEAAGQPVIVLRCLARDAVSKDIFGNAENAYTPHNLQMAYELDAAAKQKAASKDLEKVMFEACRPGIRIQILEIADGTAVSEASMNAASPSEEYDDLWWPLKGQ
jgi:hypothetical protein